MHNFFSKTSLSVLPRVMLKIVNVLMLASLLFSNFTGVVQARVEDSVIAKSVGQENISVANDINSSTSFTHTESKAGNSEGGSKVEDINLDSDSISSVPGNSSHGFSTYQAQTFPPLIVSSTYYMDSVRTTLSQNPVNYSLYVSDSSGFAIGDEILVIVMKGTLAGRYETAFVDLVEAGRLELSTHLSFTYDTLIGSVMVQEIPHFGNVTVNSGGNITAHAWNGTTGGVVFFRADSIMVGSGGKIDVSGLGYRGGGATTLGEGPGGGKAGINYYWDATGGGGGSYGVSGYRGHRGSSCSGCWNIWGSLPGNVYGAATLDNLYLGSGGGGGGASLAHSWKPGRAGQAGGGVIYLDAQIVDVNGRILSNGLAATAKTTCGNMDDGGGGGGSGGSLYIKAPNITINPSASVSAIGGSGNIDPNSICSYGSTGGQGGLGRIRLDYSFLSGSTTPPPDYSQVVSANLSDVSASSTNLPANGTSSSTITVTVYDTANTPIQGANVTLNATGSASILQPTSPTNSLGKTTGKITDLVGETVTVSATVNGVLLNETVNVTFRNGDLSLSMAAPGSAVANSTVNYTITVRQSSEKAAENVTLQLQLPQDVTFVNQNSPVTPTQSGQTLTWSLGTFAAGSSLSFVASGQIPASTVVGEVLGAQANVTSSTPEVTLANNSAAHQITIVDGHSFTASIPPVSQIFSASAAAVYKVLIDNTGLLPDTFNLDVTGLEAGWYTLSQSTVTLASGGSTQVDVTIQPLGCPPPAGITFTVTVSSGSQSMPLAAHIDFQSGPVLSGLRPGNAFLFGSRDVSISWSSNAPTTGVLNVYPVGQPGSSRTYQSEISTLHSVLVTGLERNTTYEWYVHATSDCGSTTSSPQQFTIGNGVVFKSHEQSYTIKRDYDQTALVSVTNQDSVARNVHLKIEHPYEDLTVNFRGSGSIDGDVTLLPGETRSVELAFFAQDVENKNYDINAILTSTDGTDTVSDLAVIHVKVLFPGDYTIQEISNDPILNIATYRLTNIGQPITDLNITAEDPTTHLPAQVMITPQIYHARVGTGEHIDFRVIPLYSAAQATSPVSGTGTSHGILASPSRDAISDIIFELVTEAASKVRRTQVQKNCDGNVYAVTFDEPISVSLPYTTWYCPNREHVTILLSTPPFVDVDNLLGGMIQMGFSPYSQAEPHNVSISMNGSLLGSMQNTVPNGTYSFPLSPSQVKTGFMTSAQQTISIDAHFANYAHYQIGTGGNLTIVMDTVTVFVCAHSAEEARQIAEATYGMTPAADTINLQIELPASGATVEPDEKGLVNVRAFVGDNLPAYQNVYLVSAEVEYLDHLGTPTENLLLFDDGKAGHGDGIANDRYFNAQWIPRLGGQVRLTVTAATGYGLSDTDTRTFTINAQPDFEVKNVSIRKISRAGQAAEVFAEIRNNGFSVNGPITVMFLYYKTVNGQKIGEPIYTSDQQIFRPVLGYGIPFRHGESIPVSDNTFIGQMDKIYYVEVIVDPSPIP